eukprot:Sspe_Gene.66972::Locus_39550_Transcript_2_2_Confidence_0.500_Length_609::g.66972::m.66972
MTSSPTAMAGNVRSSPSRPNLSSPVPRLTSPPRRGYSDLPGTAQRGTSFSSLPRGTDAESQISVATEELEHQVQALRVVLGKEHRRGEDLARKARRCQLKQERFNLTQKLSYLRTANNTLEQCLRAKELDITTLNKAIDDVLSLTAGVASDVSPAPK